MNVLMIDEDHSVIAHVEELIQKQGWMLAVAPNGNMGLRLARENRPDVILLNQRLSVFDGFDFCRQLRADRRTADLPVVMITVCDDTQMCQRGFRVGANSQLIWPFSAADLFAAMAQVQHWQMSMQRECLRADVEVELDSKSQYLLDVNDFLELLCNATPLGPERASRLRQAFLEIGQNAIEWGHTNFIDKTVRIWFRAYDDRVEVIVRDQGPGYDPGNLPHAACADDPMRHLEIREQLGLREGGFGLLIARGLVDEMKINEGGCLVTLVMLIRSWEVTKAVSHLSSQRQSFS